MNEVIERFLRNRRKWDEFQSCNNVTLQIEPIRPNVLLVEKCKDLIFVGELTGGDPLLVSGDLAFSREMEFEVTPDGLWLPTYLKESGRPARRCMEYIDDGCRQVRPIRRKRQIQYAEWWAEKLMACDYPRGLLRGFDSWK
jgi:hypothetical protein